VRRAALGTILVGALLMVAMVALILRMDGWL
jgi:hypothetical protein